MGVTFLLPVAATVVLAVLWWRSGRKLNSSEFYRLMTVLAGLALAVSLVVLG